MACHFTNNTWLTTSLTKCPQSSTMQMAPLKNALTTSPSKIHRSLTKSLCCFSFIVLLTNAPLLTILFPTTVFFWCLQCATSSKIFCRSHPSVRKFSLKKRTIDRFDYLVHYSTTSYLPLMVHHHLATFKFFRTMTTATVTTENWHSSTMAVSIMGKRLTYT